MIGAEACPICGRPADERRRPFCSSRCADVDLGRWLTGAYVFPVSSEGEEDLEDLRPGQPPAPGQDKLG